VSKQKCSGAVSAHAYASASRGQQAGRTSFHVFHRVIRKVEAANDRARKIVILTSHVFLSGYRKASIHFVAQNWAEQGHEVHFLTVGHSWLTYVKDRQRYLDLSARQHNCFESVGPNLWAGAYLPPIHAFSSGRGWLNRLNGPAFSLYGNYLPSFARDQLADADLVVIESGTALCFFDLANRINPEARLLYFCRDLLKSVGASPALEDIEQRAIPLFDTVCVPSLRLATRLPKGGRVRFVPQGVDAGLFDRRYLSPYPHGSVNAVSVGDMLFDEAAVAGMADAAPHVGFHVFGAQWHGTARPNVVIYGERDFESIVPYITHADIGLAPYRMTPGEIYLSESSLKLPQYSYCRLPIILPDLIPFHRGNAVTYSLDGPVDWRAKIDEALALPHSDAYREGILTWHDVAHQTLEAAFEA
jgi:2-beta-glucuronyltransferase